MAKDVVDFEGFEWGRIDGNLSSGGGSGGSGVIGSYDIVQNQYNRPGYQIKFEETGIGTAYFSRAVNSLGAGGVDTYHQVFRLYFAVGDLPTSGHLLPIAGMRFNHSTNKWAVIRLRSDGFLEAGFILANSDPMSALDTGSVVSALKIVPRGWYRLDVHIDTSGSTYTIDWQITGNVQTQATASGGAAAYWAFPSCGIENAAGWTGTLYFDDFAVANAASEYPLGPGSSRILKINGPGIHNTPTVFQEEDSTPIDANSYLRLVDDPIPEYNVINTAAGNGLSTEQFGPFASANYLEWLYDDTTLDTGIGEEIACITAAFTHYAAGSHSAFMGLEHFISGTSVGVRQVLAGGTSMHVQNDRWRSGSVQPGTRLPVPSGGWDETKANTIKLHQRVNNNDLSRTSTDIYGLAYAALQVHVTSTITETLPSPGPVIGTAKFAPSTTHEAAVGVATHAGVCGTGQFDPSNTHEIITGISNHAGVAGVMRMSL